MGYNNIAEHHLSLPAMVLAMADLVGTVRNSRHRVDDARHYVEQLVAESKLPGNGMGSAHGCRFRIQ